MGSQASKRAAAANPVLDEVSVEGIAKYIKSGQCEKIVVMIGAGISTAAGIPDFRSPGSGLYDNVAKYNLPFPQAMFQINYFKVSYQTNHLCYSQIFNVWFN